MRWFHPFNSMLFFFLFIFGCDSKNKKKHWRIAAAFITTKQIRRMIVQCALHCSQVVWYIIVITIISIIFYSNAFCLNVSTKSILKLKLKLKSTLFAHLFFENLKWACLVASGHTFSNEKKDNIASNKWSYFTRIIIDSTWICNDASMFDASGRNIDLNFNANTLQIERFSILIFFL